MQIRLPRPKDHEPRRKRPPIVSTADNPICAICERQISRYHCPVCNLPYCSLACYKAPEHESCSERFDRQSLVDEIKSAQGKSAEEKRAMMDMLKRFEDEARDDDENEEDGEGEERGGEGADLERDQLEKRLEGIDLDALPPDELLALLSPAQQAAFSSTLADPARVNALVAQELEAEQPWWTEDDQEDEESDEPSLPRTARPKLVDPALLPELPIEEATGKLKTSPGTLFNIVAVLIAYSFTLRTFSLPSLSTLPSHSSERPSILAFIAQLVPFLFERSTLTLDSLDGAVEYVASRDETIASSPLLVALLLRDVSELLQPSPVSELGEVLPSTQLASHALVMALAGLSDLHHFLLRATTPPTSSSHPETASKPSLIARPSGALHLSKSQRSQAALAGHKVVFYVAFLSSPRSSVDARLAASIARRAETGARAREVEAEATEAAKVRRATGRAGLVVDPARSRFGDEERRGEDGQGSKIVELE
ncbi:hypothetical protein JCM10212_003563 [Sporobolomyces blumeae]